MIVLTSAEWESHRRGGKMAAIKMLRERTGLGLHEARRLIDHWISEGRRVAPETSSTRREAKAIEDLGFAQERIRALEAQLIHQHQEAQQVAREVRNEASQMPWGYRGVWVKACETVAEEISRKLKPRF